uniref:Conotoxin H superfamily protein n=1 Tax=Conus amadis TaxID=198732 RepID=A0AA49XA73_CONAA|nr:conotoxin precursor H superfamily protein [Conus amadis]
MRTSGRLLLLCLAVGLLLESQAHPNADAGDAIRDVGSDGTSVELSKLLERWQAKKGQRKASVRHDDHFYIFYVDSDGPFY